MASRLSNNYYLSIAGLISFAFVALKAATILLAPEQLYFFGVSIPADYANNTYLQEQNLRFGLFLLVSYVIFTSYCVIAETTNISLPFMVSVLLPFALLSILSALLTLSMPLAEPISASYRYWPIWVINSLTELMIAVLAIVGLKRSWRRLTAKINYQQNIVMICAIIIGFCITLFYVPDNYTNWSLSLVKQHKELLSLLLYELGWLIATFWFNLPKNLGLLLLSIAIVIKLGHSRHFIYALLLSFTLLQFILKELPIISVLTTSSSTKTGQVQLVANSLTTGLFVMLISFIARQKKATLRKNDIQQK